MAKKATIEGMAELEAMMKRLDKLPQRVVTKAAKAGANIPYKAAKADAPEDTGALKAGIILKPERRTKLGKKVYDVLMNPVMNEQFVKITKDGTRYYYPASQEYGFMTVNGEYVPGYNYFRNAMTRNAWAIEEKVIEVASKDVTKILRG
ncbi:HK97 gp10 family phage protein [Paenibacillus glycanilyticus]|uniref:HK97 gp10 family phage protein n=1 Tax=Paenibacillus glycanilyticus TaxID=126569 RepID=UPI001FD488AA|nr:HK97 gp10 family phage protein [Paenibacillus glycanilyticus]